MTRKRILFVDDEPRILMGLQRMLRKMRKEWDVAFAEGGAIALEMLAKDEYDVVVSDMRMPGMDGSQLLTEVQKRYPMVVRIVLSGQSDQDMILKSVRPAHQYLSKPCDPDILRSTIRRAFTLRDLLNDDSVKRVVSQTEYIPSLPTIHNQIVEALRDDAPIKEIGKIISKDIAMTAKILQLVNSAFFGIPSHVSNPEQAVHLLGLETIKALTLTVEVFSEFDTIEVENLDIQKIYDHSILTGALARKIATEENSDKETIDNSFMAGMLHDLGKLILIANFSKEYREVMRLAKDDQISLYSSELKVIGASHAEIGAYLLGLWGLPDTIVEGVAFHHNPSGSLSDSFSPIAAVYIANLLIHRDEVDEGDFIEKFDDEFLKQLNISDRIPTWSKLLQQMKLGEEPDE
jgi:putative nucleotidyltransferase with HDIG domain